MRIAKKYRLRAGNVPESNPCLSGVVYVVDSQGRGYTYVRFDESFVVALGKRMPRGIAIDDPCYLKVMRMSDGTWRAWCLYKDGEDGVMVYESSHRPVWLGEVKRS